MINDQRIKGLQAGQEITEALGGRGTGTLLIKRRAKDAQPTAYFRYSLAGKRQTVAIGRYKETAGMAGLTLAELRGEARRLSDLLRLYPDLKEHLEQERVKAEHEQQERLRLAAIEAAKGTFRQLFSAYIDDRASAGVREQQVKDFRRILAVDLERFPSIMSLPAKDVAPAHINQLLTPIVERGAVRQAAKVRSFLMAAFQYGIKRDNQIGMTGSVTFDLSFNPVTAVTFSDEHKQIINKVGRRALSEAELRRFYKTIDAEGSGVSFAMAQLFRMVIATGGQRIEQLAREPWTSYKDDAVCLIDAKGKGGIKRQHFVPLSGRAKAILRELKPFTGQHSHPFSMVSDKPLSSEAFSKATRRWLETDHAILNGERIKHFTPRDLRRSLTQLMQTHGISNGASDELQSHGLGGVVSEHYRNNPELSIPSKKKTMDALERILSRVLDGQGAGASNVVPLRAVK